MKRENSKLRDEVLMSLGNLSVLILLFVVMGLDVEISPVEPICLFVEVKFFVVCRVSS